MRKSLTALAAATSIGVATVATSTTADARWGWGGWWGPAIGGFAVGALIGSALARPYYGYGYGYPAYYGYGYPAYYGYGHPAYYGYPRYYSYGFYAPRPYYRRYYARAALLPLLGAMAFTLPLTCTSAATLICPDLPEGPVSNIPLKKAPTRSRGLSCWCGTKGTITQTTRPLGWQ
jgi:hypothetical protein